jgi:hypothetical protein
MRPPCEPRSLGTLYMTRATIRYRIRGGVAKCPAKGLVPWAEGFCEPHFSIYPLRSSDSALCRAMYAEYKLMTREYIVLTRCFVNWRSSWEYLTGALALANIATHATRSSRNLRALPMCFCSIRSLVLRCNGKDLKECSVSRYMFRHA